uniref:Nudix hydrolase domain-containing protein n=1 Tax=viral metagenome TaxID=1070528 RepID=A0A6C0AQQ9_9ZZZZ
MFCCTQPPIVLHTTFPSYTGAGILFTEGPVAIAGVQKHYKHTDTILSGFGGRREASDQDWVHTAFRETVEELYNTTNVPIKLINALRRQIVSLKSPMYTNGYVIIQLNFDQLRTFLKICRTYLLCEIYKQMPTTLDDLILKRCPSSSSEIGALALIPVAQAITIDPEFLGDLIKKN